MDIRVNSNRALAALKRTDDIGGAINSLLLLVLNTFREQVRQNLETQGDAFGKWQPASKWTVAKKGSSKLFAGKQENIRIRNAPGRGEVVFVSPGNWTLTQHQEGFTVPPTGELVTLDLKNPGAVGAKSSKFSFISRRPSVVPARRMWPTEKKAVATAEPLITRWVKALEAGIAA